MPNFLRWRQLPATLFAWGGLIFLGSSGAGAAVLEWDASPEPDVAGYKFYTGTKSRDYNVVVDVGTRTAADIGTLDPGCTYFIAVTAYSNTGLESAFSEEISYVLPIDGTNAATIPYSLIVLDNAAAARLSFTGKGGQTYLVQASTDLRSWQTILNVYPSSDGPVEFIDPDSSLYPARFYRVLAWPAIALP